MSIYIGAGVGFLLCFHARRYKGVHIPQIMLYCTTGMLLFLSLTTLFITSYCPSDMFPFALEISAIIPPLIIFLNRKRFLDYHTVQSKRCCKRLFAKGAEAAIVSARVVLIISFLHFLIIFLTVLIQNPLDKTTRYILFNTVPPAVFILCIIFNQFGIHYFNAVMKQTFFVPIVNKKGDVIGKVIAGEAINQKNDYINPVIRIAVASHGMLFLLPRPQCTILEEGKIDLPMEGYLLYGESLEQGTSRVFRQVLPTVPISNIHFNLMYHFENERTNRLVYLFLLDLDDDSILCNEAFKEGKLWIFQQIEQNLNCNFFSQCFEYEYEHLKSIINTREKYKEI